MGTSFVEIGDKGFWMRDGILQLWLRLLALHIEESPNEQFIGRKIRDNWLLGSGVCFTGCVPDELEDAVSSSEGRAIVLRAIDSLLDALKRCPQKLDHHTLNLLGIGDGGVFIVDFESSRLIEIGNAFIALITGEIQSDATSTAFMPGSRIAT